MEYTSKTHNNYKNDKMLEIVQMRNTIKLLKKDLNITERQISIFKKNIPSVIRNRTALVK